MCKGKEQRTESYYLENSTGAYPIDIQHWWQGKVFGNDVDGGEICLFRKSEIKRALRPNKDFGGKVNNNYMTVAICITPEKTYRSTSKCLSIDQPTRKYGRDHSLGLLHQEALRDGYDLTVMSDPHG